MRGRYRSLPARQRQRKEDDTEVMDYSSNGERIATQGVHTPLVPSRLGTLPVSQLVQPYCTAPPAILHHTRSAAGRPPNLPLFPIKLNSGIFLELPYTLNLKNGIWVIIYLLIIYSE